MDRVWALWGKSGTDTWHPLLCHLTDVAEVASVLWQRCLSPSFRRQLALSVGLTEEDAASLVTFLVATHDLGKASPVFQRQVPRFIPPLIEAGLPFPEDLGGDAYHGTISAAVLRDLVRDHLGISSRTCTQLATVVGGHHGSWPLSSEIVCLRTYQIGGAEWDAVRKELVLLLADLYRPASPTAEPDNAFLTLLSGLTSVADWIGSMERFFPHAPTVNDPQAYCLRARDQAEAALNSLGWGKWTAPEAKLSFTDLFEFSPRPMQQAVIDLAPHLEQPSLVVIEAGTGEGKTEAALYLSDRWASALAQQGLYVAMPTMATSNQMHRRAGTFLAHRYPDGSASALLVHSRSRWQNGAADLGLQTTDEREPDGTDAVDSLSWFLPRKRSLLAPFGVGTVDQAFLSVLQTRHFFVRLFGLSHKTIIFDEVHAYDSYMATIFQRLLSWLRAVGCSVIVLSATLTAATRRDLLAAYGLPSSTDMPEATYPRITWCSGGGSGAVPLEACSHRRVELAWVERGEEGLANLLTTALDEGGCAAVICNTVAQAQRLYRYLKAVGVVEEDELYLFHARFPYRWRDEIEKRALAAFGKDGPRPCRAIIVATQVIEQSLDLDFDLMVSYLAPVDLILQRAGRLHRHEGRRRPDPLQLPRLFLVRPEETNSLPQFGADGWVYEPYILLQTYLALRDRSHLSTPEDTEELIERVYSEDFSQAPSPYQEALAEAHRRLKQYRERDVFVAEQKLVGGPEVRNLLRQRNLALKEDNPDVHASLQALTRLGLPSVSLVCLHRTSAGLCPEPDSATALNLDCPPDDETTRMLADCTVSVTSHVVVSYFRDQPVPPAWQRHSLLRDHRLVTFENGLCPLPGTGYTLRLTLEYGLELIKEKP